MNAKTMNLPIQTRLASVAPTTINHEARTVEVVWTTGASVKRYDFWSDEVFNEELIVAGADLSRLNAGAPLLNSHSGNDLRDVIGVVERAWLNSEKKQGHASVRFSDRAEVEPVWSDVKSGILRNISVGYSIDAAERIPAEQKGDLAILRVTRFTPMELSLVAVPADAGAQVRASDRTFSCTINEVSKMTDEANEVIETSPPDVNVEQIRREHRKAKQLGAQEAIGAERKRVRELDELFAMNIVPQNEFYGAIRVRAIDEGWGVEPTRKYLLEVLSGEAEPAVDHSTISDSAMGMGHVPAMPPQAPVRGAPPVYQGPAVPTGSGFERRSFGRIDVMRDATDTLAQSVEQALLIRRGIETDKAVMQDARERGVFGLTYVEMGRRLLEANGHRTAGLDKHGVAKAMLLRAGPMTHSDFTNVLANVATKIAKKGYEEAPTTYQDWCSIGYLPDFKPATIPGLGAFSDLDAIPKSGAPYLFGTVGESYETAELGTYGKLFGISRVALVNDDLNLFTRAGLAMGGAAARKVNALAYAVLTGNQTMSEDSTACFIAGHSNFVAQGSGAAPSTTTLNTAEAAMALQTAPKQSTDSTSAYLNITPAHLIVPVALKATADVLVQSQYDPAGTTASTSRRDAPNRWRGRLQVTADAALGGSTATGWYLAAARGNTTIDTVTVFFLEGTGGQPSIEEQTAFDSDGIAYKVRIDAVARALDFRGLYYNYGA